MLCMSFSIVVGEALKSKAGTFSVDRSSFHPGFDSP